MDPYTSIVVYSFQLLLLYIKLNWDYFPIFSRHLLNVFLNTGTKGKTKMIKLDNWGNDFEKGDVDEYSVEAMDVGEVLMVHLHNSGGGWWHKNPDWFVNRISVISSSQEDPFEFPCYRWVLSDLVVFEGKGKVTSIQKGLSPERTVATV